MKAIICQQWGDPSALTYEEVSSQPLAPGHVRIAVHAADVGYQDVVMVAGKYALKPQLPFTPGNVVSGVIRECGDDVTDHAAGDRVLALLPFGGFTEEVVVPAQSAVAIQDAVSLPDAAALGIAYGTAYQGLVERARITPGEVLLVRGAAGGVGRAAVELGHTLGAVVIAAASSPDKLNAARRAGADHLIDTSSEMVRDRVLEITDGRGADVIFDPVGADFKQACLRSIARKGRILIVGFAGGEIPSIPAHYILNKYCAVLGVAWGFSVFEKEPSDYRKVLTDLLNMRAKNQITPLISNTIRPEQISSALRGLSSRSSIGRTVVVFQHLNEIHSSGGRKDGT